MLSKYYLKRYLFIQLYFIDFCLNSLPYSYNYKYNLTKNNRMIHMIILKIIKIK